MTTSASPPLQGAAQLQRLTAQVEELRRAVLAYEQTRQSDVAAAAPTCRASARNLIHYLAARQHDLRGLQGGLFRLGLSSLGRLEAQVLPTLNAVLQVLRRLSGSPVTPELSWPPELGQPDTDMDLGARLLRRNTALLLGPGNARRRARIMVTMPAEAADDPSLIRRALERGMDIMRINCAHDDPAAWLRMVTHLGAATEALGRECRTEFDLAGPKLRTGPVAPGPPVLKWKPERDQFGRVSAAARLLLIPNCVESKTRPTKRAAGRRAQARPFCPRRPDRCRSDQDTYPTLFADRLESEQDGMSAAPEPPTFPGVLALPLLPGHDLQAQVGDELHLTDTRGRRRRLTVSDITPDGWHCTCQRTGYVTSGHLLRLRRQGRLIGKLRLGELAPLPQALQLGVGDRLVLTRSPIPGENAVDGQSAHIGCTLPQIFDAVKPGHRILFDDGKLSGVIRQVSPERLSCEITQVAGGRFPKSGSGRRLAKLRAEKGINLPDTGLRLPVLGEADLASLAALCAHAQLVSLSFVRRQEDIEALIAELQRLELQRLELRGLGAAHLGIVLKIENRQAFEALPELLLAALRHGPAAVMVARGDLAVEIGFDRLAEVQEEILWLCEAAHVPVIWATQVLDTLARTGAPTRAEVTDAAMAGRAEAVMLNKGPYIDEAITFLGNVLERMHDHQDKKKSMLRKLRVSGPAR